jgi:sugar (pentulose or hexulose) kinase
MTPPTRTVEPDAAAHERYGPLYEVYRTLYPALRDVFPALRKAVGH